MNDDLTPFANAIGSIESGNRYDVVTPSGGRKAYGRYQVMGENIPEWTKSALGKELTPDEFLADPSAQDVVFQHQFGGYLNKYGNPQDAASAWFSGRPQAQAGEAKDALGTSVPEYMRRFNAALNGTQQPQSQSNNALMQPARFAWIDPNTIFSEWAGKRNALNQEMNGGANPLAVWSALRHLWGGNPITVIDAQGKWRTVKPVSYDPFGGA